MGLAFTVFGVLAIAFLFSLTSAGGRPEMALAVLTRLRAFGAIGWLVFIGLQLLVAVAGFLPASLLGLAAGAVYGVAFGFSLAATGVLLGAEISFILTRSGLRSMLISLFENSPALQQFDTALAQQGWRLVLLLRASPVMPFSLTSFALGLSGVNHRAYTLGTIGSLPALLLYVILGDLGAEGVVAAHHGTGIWHFLLLGLGIATTLLLAITGGRLYKNLVQ